MALQLRPNCEYCDKDLPPNATDARICSYECTFCADCVENKLHNVCPNCGGGFAPRPIRPAKEWRPGVSVAKQPPSDKRVHLKYSLEDVAAHSAGRDIPPEALSSAVIPGGASRESGIHSRPQLDRFDARMPGMTEAVTPPAKSCPRPRRSRRDSRRPGTSRA